MDNLQNRLVWGRMDTCICTAESICCPPRTITTLLIGYTPIQNEKFNNQKKNKDWGSANEWKNLTRVKV